MNHLFIEFRDPLFGIIVFFFLLFILSFLSYWWKKVKSIENHKHLDDFLKQFHTLPTEDELKNLIQNSNLSTKSWLLLASSYAQNGDYEKSIEVYQILLKQKLSKSETRESLFLLGKTYLKAGFLERAKDIFLTILENEPRTPQALHYLLLVYEQLQDFKQASEALEPLEELGEDTLLDSIYLEAKGIIHASTCKEDTQEKLLALYKEHAKMSYLIFEYLFRHNPELAWQHVDQSQVQRLSPIFWHLDKAHLNLDIITNNSYLRELFSANGSLDVAKDSSVFELDVLIKLKKNGTNIANLQFEYLCSSCKQVLPFVFHRCPCCYEIDTLVCELNLSKKSVESYDSFL